MSTLNPYLGFSTSAREAMTFYQSVFGGELTVSTYGESGMGEPDEADKVMHAQLETPHGFTLMGSDGPASIPNDEGSSISISLSGSSDEEAELRGYWDKLSEGATIEQPLVQAPWGDHFGMLADRFGTRWMVNIAGAQQQS